jgi:hypothetical protein
MKKLAWVDYNLHDGLEMFLGQPLSKNDFDGWLSGPGKSLAILSNKKWSLTSDSLFLRCFDGNFIETLAKDKKKPDYSDVTYSELFGGNGSIPKLFYFSGPAAIPDFSKPASRQAKLVSENLIILDILGFLFGMKPGIMTEMAAEKILKANKKSFENLHGITGDHAKKLGKGSDGIAFQVNEHQVIKFIVNDYVYNEAIKAMKRLVESPELSKTEAMIYDAGKLFSFNGKNVYYILLERMTPVWDLRKSRDKIQDIMLDIVSRVDGDPLIDKIKSMIANKSSAELLKFISLTLLKIEPEIQAKFKKEIAEITAAGKLRDSWVASFIEEIIMKIATSRGDLHIGNIGVTSYGDLRYFDPAYEGYQSNLNYNAMEKDKSPKQKNYFTSMSSFDQYFVKYAAPLLLSDPDVKLALKEFCVYLGDKLFKEYVFLHVPMLADKLDLTGDKRKKFITSMTTKLKVGKETVMAGVKSYGKKMIFAKAMERGTGSDDYDSAKAEFDAYRLSFAELVKESFVSSCKAIGVSSSVDASMKNCFLGVWNALAVSSPVADDLIAAVNQSYES